MKTFDLNLKLCCQCGKGERKKHRTKRRNPERAAKATKGDTNKVTKKGGVSIAVVWSNEAKTVKQIAVKNFLEITR